MIVPRLRAPFLDGLRGFSSLWVVYGHFSMHMRGYGSTTTFDPMAGYGVTIFFVLSAFLLTAGAIVEWGEFCQREQAKYAAAKLWSRYFVRRIFRIYPTYLLVVLMATYAVPQAYLNFLTPHSLFGNLSLTEAQWILWAIPLEVEYYFVIPILVLLYQRAVSARHPVMARVVLYTSLVIIGIASMRTFGDIHLAPGSMWWIHLPRRLWEFLTGSLVALVYTDIRRHAMHEAGAEAPPRRRDLTRTYDVLAFVCIGLLFLSLPHYSQSNPLLRESWPFISLFVGGAILFGLLSREDSYFKTAFSWSFLRKAGQVSFSTYLLHPLGFYASSRILGALTQAPDANDQLDQIMFGWLLTAALAFLSWRWVEKPGMELGTRINRLWLE